VCSFRPVTLLGSTLERGPSLLTRPEALPLSASLAINNCRLHYPATGRRLPCAGDACRFGLLTIHTRNMLSGHNKRLFFTPLTQSGVNVKNPARDNSHILRREYHDASARSRRRPGISRFSRSSACHQPPTIFNLVGRTEYSETRSGLTPAFCRLIP